MDPKRTSSGSVPGNSAGVGLNEPLERLRRHVSAEEIPASDDLMSSDDLERALASRKEGPFALVAVGDIMLGGRLRRVIKEEGEEYPFAAVRPLLRRAEILVGNLEGPFAQAAFKQKRNFSYCVRPDLAGALARAGFCALTLANNHLLDCGREGVVETLEALDSAGLTPVGAGLDRSAAHVPRIFEAGGRRVGLLAYYWNRRTAATSRLPGSAMDSRSELQEDIRNLRGRVDHVVAFFHWGVPYVREPSPEDREKARFAVECGADIVIGHHPHIIQPFEIWRGCPIFYSVGNFAFGSGNSRAESLLLGVKFTQGRTTVHVHPLYVKNRDPRAHYQPRALRGVGARRVLMRLKSCSGRDGEQLTIEDGRGVLELPRSASAFGSAAPA